MSQASLFYLNEKLGKSQPRELVFVWKITGAKTVVPHMVPGIPVLSSFDAISQATIDAFLTSPTVSSTNEFLAAQFDATSMGAQAFGFIVNMTSQVSKLVYLKSELYVQDPGVTPIPLFRGANSGALTSSTLVTECAVSAASATAPGGNIGVKLDYTGGGLDAATAGWIYVRLGWISK